MALNQAKLQRLERASLVAFFEEKKAIWKRLYRDAADYAGTYIKKGELRQDDVIEALVPALEVTQLLTTKLLSKKLTQQYWVGYFADLIVDSLWDDEDEGDDS